MRTIATKRSFKSDAIIIFDILDDLGVTGMHMTKDSMPMMGGRMYMEFLSSYKTGLNTSYRWTGKVMWLYLDFTVVVTEWKRGVMKTWETQGPSKLIIYSWFRMNMKIDQIRDLSKVTLSISYKKPYSIFGRILCYLLGDWYCRWCINSMLTDAAKQIDSIKAQSSTA